MARVIAPTGLRVDHSLLRSWLGLPPAPCPPDPARPPGPAPPPLPAPAAEPGPDFALLLDEPAAPEPPPGELTQVIELPFAAGLEPPEPLPPAYEVVEEPPPAYEVVPY